MMEMSTVGLLACPACHGGLTLDNEVIAGGEVQKGRLTCNACGLRYDISNGAAYMLPPLPENEHWAQWEHKQELGLEEYESPDPEYKAYYDRVAAEFGAFCQLTGDILDIGCGIEREPAYAVRPRGSRYVGIDPFIGEQERAFDFVQGIGESLPFRAASFDRVICATSLDHVPDPSRVLSEARRVLKHSGLLGLWVGVLNLEHVRELYEPPYKLRDLAYRERRRELLERVRERGIQDLPKVAWRNLVVRPVGRVRMRLDEAGTVASVYAERSVHHFHFFKAEEIEELVTRCGYEIVKRRLLAGGQQRGDSLFLLAAPNQER